MSKSTWIAASAIAAIMTSASFAVTPSSRDTGNLDFGLLEGDLSGWHLAVYGAGATRNLENGDDVIERDLALQIQPGDPPQRVLDVFRQADGEQFLPDTLRTDLQQLVDRLVQASQYTVRHAGIAADAIQ